MNQTENIMFRALVSHFTAKRDEALATLSVYFSNPVGIGEHPQIIEEMVKQVKLLDEATSCIDRLNQTFKIENDDNIDNSSTTS